MNKSYIKVFLSVCEQCFILRMYQTLTKIRIQRVWKVLYEREWRYVNRPFWLSAVHSDWQWFTMVSERRWSFQAFVPATRDERSFSKEGKSTASDPGYPPILSTHSSCFVLADWTKSCCKWEEDRSMIIILLAQSILGSWGIQKIRASHKDAENEHTFLPFGRRNLAYAQLKHAITSYQLWSPLALGEQRVSFCSSMHRTTYMQHLGVVRESWIRAILCMMEWYTITQSCTEMTNSLQVMKLLEMSISAKLIQDILNSNTIAFSVFGNV